MAPDPARRPVERSNPDHELSLAHSPVALDPHITTAPRRPVSRGPHIARRGRDGPVARHPGVAPASPCPVPRHPDVRGTRSSGDDLHLRWGQRRGGPPHDRLGHHTTPEEDRRRPPPPHRAERKPAPPRPALAHAGARPNPDLLY